MCGSDGCGSVGQDRLHLKPCGLADLCQMLGDLCCWHHQEPIGSIPNMAATVSSESLIPTYQTTLCHTPEDEKMSERSTGFSHILCLILSPLLAFAFTADASVLLSELTVANYTVWLLQRRHTKQMGGI
jgi:hypothetical protein